MVAHRGFSCAALSTVMNFTPDCPQIRRPGSCHSGRPLYRRSMATPTNPSQWRTGPSAPGSTGDFLSTHRTTSGAPVVVRRSARRTRGVAAFWEGGAAVIAVPARLTRAEESYWVPHMLARLEKDTRNPSGGPGRRRRAAPSSDDALLARSAQLSATYLGGRAVPASVRWVTNQNTRWGSATPAAKTIRISHQVRDMPGWVLDYVLLHELAHLLVASHSAAFWAELAGYPELERARAFLDGAAFAAARGITGTGEDEDQPDILTLNN